MKLYRFLLFLLTFLSQNCLGQELNADSLFKVFKTGLQIKLVENYENVKCEDENRITYYLLILNSTVENIKTYTNDSSAAVRCYMFRALIYKNAEEKILYDILNAHANDTAKYAEITTDVVIYRSVKELMQTTLDYKIKNELPNIDLRERIEKIRDKIKYDNYVFVKGAKSGIIKKEELLKTDGISCSNTNFKIQSFLMSLEKDRNKLFKSKGSAFSYAMWKKIRKLNSGEKIFFEDIIAIWIPDGKTRRLPSLILTIE